MTKEQKDSLNRFSLELLRDMESCTPKKLKMWEQNGEVYERLKTTGDQMMATYLRMLDQGADDSQATEVVREYKYAITNEDL
jgi:hypothetical protein